MMSTTRILIVEDELSIRLYLEETLVNDGHQVTAVASGEEALEVITHQEFDLALLDLMLGGISGLEVLTVLHRQAPDTVVIILTAHGSLESAVEALRQGAHDYLFKPCKTVQLRESIRQGLVKRQRQLQQRYVLYQLERRLTDELNNIRTTLSSNPTRLPPVEVKSLSLPSLPTDKPLTEQGRFLHYGALIVDSSQHIITLNGHLLELSPTEFDVLAYMVSTAPRVISPQELIREVQGYTIDRWEARDMVRQHVHNIRQKIREATGRSDVIKTVRGIGYTIAE